MYPPQYPPAAQEFGAGVASGGYGTAEVPPSQWQGMQSHTTPRIDSYTYLFVPRPRLAHHLSLSTEEYGHQGLSPDVVPPPPPMPPIPSSPQVSTTHSEVICR